MMKSSKLFRVAGSGSGANTWNLKAHVAARARVVKYASSFNPVWDETGNGKLPPDDARPRKGESWADWFQRLNKSSTHVRCAQANAMILLAASEGNIQGRANDHIYIPGDWAYLKNEAFKDPPWPTGYEGENIICMDVVSSGDDKFWGFPYKTVKTLGEWKTFIRVEFPRDANVTGPGKPVEGAIRGYPFTGLQD
jgi:hypothetical protein